MASAILPFAWEPHLQSKANEACAGACGSGGTGEGVPAGCGGDCTPRQGGSHSAAGVPSICLPAQLATLLAATPGSIAEMQPRPAWLSLTGMYSLQDAELEQERAAAGAACADQLQAAVCDRASQEARRRRSSLRPPSDRRQSNRRTSRRVSIVEASAAANRAPQRSTDSVPPFRP